jgi:Reverse transcriptase (RNA-dependent DNA polymerase)
LLCNVYLHRLDRAWDVREHGVLVRYADDALVLCTSRQQAKAALARLQVLLADRGLEPKQAKTRIVHLQVGGKAMTSSALSTGWYAMRRVVGQARHLPGPLATNKAMQHARDRIRELTHRSRLWLHVGEIVGTSTGSCTAGPRTSSTATRPGTSTRSDTTRACGWRCLSARATAAAARSAGGGRSRLTQPAGSGQPDRNRRRPRPFRDWREKPNAGGERVGEPCARKAHARIDGGGWKQSTTSATAPAAYPTHPAAHAPGSGRWRHRPSQRSLGRPACTGALD